MIRTISRNPVAFLAALITVLTAVDGVLEPMHVLTPTESAWGAGIIAVFTAVLGALTHRKVTPLADPRDNRGRQLAPRQPSH